MNLQRISMSNMMYWICNFLVIFNVISNVHGTHTELQATRTRVALDAHNLHRRQVYATDMRKLVWSDELASKAQNYANLCNTDKDAVDTFGIRGRLINICTMTAKTGRGSVIHPLTPQYNASASHCGPNGDPYYRYADLFGDRPFWVPTTTDILFLAHYFSDVCKALSVCVYVV